MTGAVRIASSVNNDCSANGLTVAGVLAAGNVLIATIPQNLNRKGYYVQNQSAADIYLAFDDSAAAALTPTILILSAGGGANMQGSSNNYNGNPHHGRIRIYGAALAQVAAADW